MYQYSGDVVMHSVQSEISELQNRVLAWMCMYKTPCYIISVHLFGL